MSKALRLASKRQRLINELLTLVDGLSDSALLRLQERALYLADVYPRYSSVSAEITSLAEWRNRHGKAADHQRDQ